jgi:hypothetical protein
MKAQTSTSTAATELEENFEMAQYSRKRLAPFCLTRFAIPNDKTDYAYLGNAVNSDTDEIADYRELTNCSEGHLWKKSCKDV